MSSEKTLVERRATGVLVIEVRNSNPNGDPDRESDPRQRQDGRGEISPVSFKRKIRDLIEDKSGKAWEEIVSKIVNVDNNRFCILEQRGRDRKEIEKELEGDGDVFKNKYWDGRVFGNTFLEEGKSTSIKTGVVQFGLGVSISPVKIERKTFTNKSGVEEGKDRGMAPLAYRIIEHGVYCMPFFINPALAHKTKCTNEDIQILLKAIPLAYRGTPSMIRNMVEIRHAWYIEHTSALGSCSDFALIDALTPRRKNLGDREKPSMSWDDYDVPTEKDVLQALKDKLYEKKVRDLMDE